MAVAEERQDPVSNPSVVSFPRLALKGSHGKQTTSDDSRNSARALPVIPPSVLRPMRGQPSRGGTPDGAEHGGRGDGQCRPLRGSREGRDIRMHPKERKASQLRRRFASLCALSVCRAEVRALMLLIPTYSVVWLQNRTRNDKQSGAEADVPRNALFDCALHHEPRSSPCDLNTADCSVVEIAEDGR